MTIILEQSTHTRTEDDIIAGTVQIQGSIPLTADNNIIAFVLNDNDAVTLRRTDAGAFQRVVNAGINTLQIFPALGENLGAGVNNSITLSPNDHIEFLGLNDINWRDLTPTALSLGLGDVDGPASALNDAIVRFDGITGKLIKSSIATLDAVGNVTFPMSVSTLNVKPNIITFNNTDTGADPVFSSSDPTDPLLTLTGDLDVTGVILTSELRVAGSNVASLGFIRMRKGDTIQWRNDANNDNHEIGFTSDVFSIKINGVADYSFDSGKADWAGNGLTNVGFIESNAAIPSPVGKVRLGNNESIGWRNPANDGNIEIKADLLNFLAVSGGRGINLDNDDSIRWDGDDNRRILNDGNGFSFEVLLTHSFVFNFQGTDEYLFNNSLADWKGNNLINFGFLESNATNPSTIATINLGNNQFMGWRDSGNSVDVKFGYNVVNKFVFEENDKTVQLELDANHAFPPANTIVGAVEFKDNNSADLPKLYAEIVTTIIDPTNTTERGSMLLAIGNAGVAVPFIVLNEGNEDTIVFKKAIDLQIINVAPPDPPLEEGRLFVSTVNGANNGLFVKIKQNNSIVEVQIA